MAGSGVRGAMGSSSALLYTAVLLGAAVDPCSAFFGGATPFIRGVMRPQVSRQRQFGAIRPIAIRPILAHGGGGVGGGGGGWMGGGGWGDGDHNGGFTGLLAAVPVGQLEQDEEPDGVMERLRGGGVPGGAFGEDYSTDDIPDVWGERRARHAVVTGANAGALTPALVLSRLRRPPLDRFYVEFVGHPGGNPGENLKPISKRCHPILVAFVWELTEDIINLPWVASRVVCGADSIRSMGRRDRA